MNATLISTFTIYVLCNVDKIIADISYTVVVKLNKSRYITIYHIIRKVRKL